MNRQVWIRLMPSNVLNAVKDSQLVLDCKSTCNDKSMVEWRVSPVAWPFLTGIETDAKQLWNIVDYEQINNLIFRCSYMAHTRIHSENGLLVCPECGENFGDNKNEFNKHIKLHCFHTSRIQGYRCPVSFTLYFLCVFVITWFRLAERSSHVSTIWLLIFITIFLFVSSNAPSVPSPSVHKIRLWSIQR